MKAGCPHPARVGSFHTPTSGQTGINARLTIEKAGATATYVGLGGYGIRGAGKFNYIGGVTVAENDHVFTVENAIPNKCERVQHFDQTGRFVQQWGKEGTGNGEFTSPCGIFNDRKGSLFVCDSYRLQQLSRNP